MENCLMSKEVIQHGLNVQKIVKKILNYFHNVEDVVIDQELSFDLLIAAELHDIGKYYIPEYVLNAARPLLPTERCVVDMHAYYGYLKLRELGYADRITQIVMLHHGKDRVPDLDKIQLCSGVEEVYQILIVADIYDAVTSNRPYRVAMSRADALHIVEKADVKGIFIDALRAVV